MFAIDASLSRARSFSVMRFSSFTSGCEMTSPSGRYVSQTPNETNVSLTCPAKPPLSSDFFIPESR